MPSDLYLECWPWSSGGGRVCATKPNKRGFPFEMNEIQFYDSWKSTCPDIHTQRNGGSHESDEIDISL
jgi:hypothetical protein